MIGALLHSRGYEVLTLMNGLDSQQAADAATRSGSRFIAFVIDGELAAQAVEQAGLAGAVRIAASVQLCTVCVYGARLLCTPPGVTPIRTLRDLAALLDR